MVKPESDDPGFTFKQVVIGDWAPLGTGDVVLDFDAHSTTVVGRNGAGKSLIMEGFQAAASAASGRRTPDTPQRARITYMSHGIEYTYSYKWSVRSSIEEAEGGADSAADHQIVDWTEKCIRADEEPVWEVRNGRIHAPGLGSQDVGSPLPTGVGALEVLGYTGPRDEPLLEDLAPFSQITNLRIALRGVSRIKAGVPRGQLSRRDLVLIRSGARYRAGGGTAPRVLAIAQQVLRWSDDPDQEDFQEFLQIMRDLGVLSDVTIRTYKDSEAEEIPPEMVREMKWIEFDGVNIGRASDGTLRVAEIVSRLMSLPKGTVLLLEEPETAVHPGLLAGLVTVMAAYTIDRQLVLTTHSPRVVDSAQPDQVRLVWRDGGETRCRSLTKSECERMRMYLEDDDGTAGDFLFSGAVSGEDG